MFRPTQQKAKKQTVHVAGFEHYPLSFTFYKNTKSEGSQWLQLDIYRLIRPKIHRF